MKFESQLQLQAYLDGELGDQERREVESWLDFDPEAHALLTELRQTRSVLLGHDSDLKLPESREFYWSKIERAICRQEEASVRTERISWLDGWRRWLAPVGAAVALVAVWVVSVQMNSSAARMPEPEVTLVDGNGIAYRDQARGMTLVWFSYPAEESPFRGAPGDTF